MKIYKLKKKNNQQKELEAAVSLRQLFDLKNKKHSNRKSKNISVSYLGRINIFVSITDINRLNGKYIDINLKRE